MPMLLDRLTRHLILNYHFAPNAGLLNGKMGGVVFFGQYAKHTGKAYFREYAEELLDEVFDMVHENIPINFVDGLCGIGWGVEYLIQNALMEGDSDDVLEDIDKKIIERDPLHIEDLSLHTGLRGVLMYITARLNAVRTESDYRPFPGEYLVRIKKRLALIPMADYENEPALKDAVLLFGKCIIGQTGSTPAVPTITDEFFGVSPENFKNLNYSPIGIYQGLTGVAFKMIRS